MKRRILTSISVLGILALALFFGQACGPAFELPSDGLTSLGSSYLSESEKAACASAMRRGESGFRNLGDLVSYLNEQPKPVQIHCVVANLPRPLKIQAGVSAASAQPSAGSSNPRILIRVGSLILAIVPDGTAKNTLEVGALKTASQATRAEFLFPISDETIQANIGLDHIRTSGLGTSTTCGFCHRGETPESGEAGITGAFRSEIVRFAESERRRVASVKQLADTCVTNKDQSDRCLLLRSLMEGGMPLEIEF